MDGINKFITLQNDLERFMLVGLSASAEPIGGGAFGPSAGMRYMSRYRFGWITSLLVLFFFL